MLEDLNTLTPGRTAKRLESLLDTALTCHAVTVFEGDPDGGLGVALHVDSRQRGSVLDLARVVDDDARVRASCAWSVLPPGTRSSEWRLLLRVSFERPVNCDFAVGFHVDENAGNPLREALPLLLAASRLVFVFDGQADPDESLLWVEAPAGRASVLRLLTAIGL